MFALVCQSHFQSLVTCDRCASRVMVAIVGYQVSHIEWTRWCTCQQEASIDSLLEPLKYVCDLIRLSTITLK